MAFNPDATALARLRNAVTAWRGAPGLDRAAFRERFLDPYTSDETVDRLRAAARLAAEARSHADLGRAGAELAGAMQRVGSGNWRRFTARAEERAVEAVSRGEVPGVVTTSGEDGDVVLTANFPLNQQEAGTQAPSSTAGVPKSATPEKVDQSLIPINYFGLDPAPLVALIPPTSGRPKRKGDPMGRPREGKPPVLAKTGVCSFTTGDRLSSGDPNDHVRFLLGIVQDRIEAIREIMRQQSLTWTAWLFEGNWEGQKFSDLDPALVRWAADLGLPLLRKEPDRVTLVYDVPTPGQPR